jgi:hypothetical protein
MVQREKNETEAISNVIWVPFAEWRKAVAAPGAPGRPVAPVDLFTMGAFGLAHMTGYLPRLQASWRKLYSGLSEDTRLSAPLSRRLEHDPDHVDVIVRCTGPEVVTHFEREMPTLHLAVVEDDSAAMRISSLSPLGLAWLLATSAVTAIELANG